MKNRFQKLAGIKPLYEQAKKPNLKSIADIDRSDWTPDGGGSIGYMEWEDGTEMTPQEIQDYFEANHELYDDIMQGLNESWYKRIPATIDGKEVDVESIEMDNLGSMRKWGPDDGLPDAYILSAEFKDGTPLTDEQKERFAEKYPEITSEKAIEQYQQEEAVGEGSCGYGPNGIPGDTPGETKGMDADNRTKIMIKKLVQKEIAKLNENKRIKKNN